MMTALVIGASLSSTGCLRQMIREEQPVMPSPSYLTEDISYFAPDAEFPIDSKVLTAQNP